MKTKFTIAAVRAALARWIAPAGTVVVPPVARTPLPAPTPLPRAAVPSSPVSEPVLYELHIKQCRDPLMWYAGLVGQRVEYCGRWPEAWKSRDTGGYRNIVHFEDAELVVRWAAC